MGTVVRASVNGRWELQPQTPSEARDIGWYCAVEYQMFYNSTYFPYEEFYEWCKETFEDGTFVIFARNAWFLRESDAVLCKLRWS